MKFRHTDLEEDKGIRYKARFYNYRVEFDSLKLSKLDTARNFYYFLGVRQCALVTIP